MKQQKPIVSLDGNKAFTTSLVIAEGCKIQHKNVMSLLKNYAGSEILTAFETAKVSRGGRPVEYAILSELQSTFLITLMRNSEVVVQYKENFITSLFEQREMISRLAADVVELRFPAFIPGLSEAGEDKEVAQ